MILHTRNKANRALSTICGAVQRYKTANCLPLLDFERYIGCLRHTVNIPSQLRPKRNHHNQGTCKRKSFSYLLAETSTQSNKNTIQPCESCELIVIYCLLARLCSRFFSIYIAGLVRKTNKYHLQQRETASPAKDTKRYTAYRLL